MIIQSEHVGDNVHYPSTPMVHVNTQMTNL